MANFTDTHIMEEGPRNAIVKLTGVLDTNNVQLPSVIALTDFTNNDHQLTPTGFRVNYIEYSISGGLEVALWWHGNAIGLGQIILPLAGRGKIDAQNYGGFNPDPNSPSHAGYDGSIDLTTTGFVAGTTSIYTIIVELVKQYS